MVRTNKPGHVTPAVQLTKSIKQGCPLAPLLFVLVMDELHTNLQECEGYTMGDPSSNKQKRTTIKSRGYCDDTWIVSHSFKDLQKMNSIVHAFSQKHGLQINRTKTKVTGIHGNDQPLTDTMYWQPEDKTPFTTTPPDKPIKYLGCSITLTLDWNPHIHRMQGWVYQTCHHLKSGRLTTYQATALTKYVTGPKMEIGMRHANIPLNTLLKWDAKIAKQLNNSAFLATAQVHQSATLRICNVTPLHDQYLTSKLTYTLHHLTHQSPLRSHYASTLLPLLTYIDQQWKADPTTLLGHHPPTMFQELPHAAALYCPLTQLFNQGIWIQANKRSRTHMSPQCDTTKTAKNDTKKKGRAMALPHFNHVQIPVLDAQRAWGSDYDLLPGIINLQNALHLSTETKAPLLEAQCWLKKNKYHHPKCQHTPMNTSLSHITAVLTETSVRANCCQNHWQRCRS